MHTLTMPIADAILASKALLNHASKDDVTPIITGAAIVEHDDKQYLVATDRYSFGRFLLGERDSFEGDPGQMIPREALVWISKIVPKSLRRAWTVDYPIAEGGYGIRLTWTPLEGSGADAMEVEVAIIQGHADPEKIKAERSQTFDVTRGNYPPVARLWRDPEEDVLPGSEVALTAMSLSKIAADVTLFEGKGGQTTLCFHFPAEKKPGPVQYTLGRWTAAVQPNYVRP